MEDWKAFLIEGEQYLKAGTGKEGRPSRLGSDIRYNLLALSIEKSAMAILVFHNDLADNHTFTDLVNALQKYVPVPDCLRWELLDLEQVQSICNLMEYHREKPDEGVIRRLYLVAEQLYLMAESTCSGIRSGIPLV